MKRIIAKCKDGKKYISVRSYERGDEVKVKRHKRSCSYQKSHTSKDISICCLCEEKHSLGNLHDVEINGEIKKVCEGCADTIHGLI